MTFLVGPSRSYDEEALVLCKGREARPSKTQRTQIWPLPLAQWVALGITPNCVTLSFPLCKMDIITRGPPSWGLLWELKGLIYVTHLAKCQELSQCYL